MSDWHKGSLGSGILNQNLKSHEEINYLPPNANMLTQVSAVIPDANYTISWTPVPILASLVLVSSGALGLDVAAGSLGRAA
jgi:hypothetical protein